MNKNKSQIHKIAWEDNPTNSTKTSKDKSKWETYKDHCEGY